MTVMKMPIFISSFEKLMDPIFLYLTMEELWRARNTGKVFYVLFMDWEDMHIRYNDKFTS